MPHEDEHPITAGSVPMPIWTRNWEDRRGQDRQALYALWVGGAPLVGVRISIHLASAAHEFQSYATAEIFDGVQWHTVAALPPPLIRTAQISSNQRYWDDDGERADTARLLEDVRLAYQYRASAEVPRTTHQPPPEDGGALLRSVRAQAAER